ncbi:hypothetical protein M5689_024718 [Euphorbia peplus]|nr:hypothetical protein M5689_024718 [Euphorbia peplus]
MDNAGSSREKDKKFGNNVGVIIRSGKRHAKIRKLNASGRREVPVQENEQNFEEMAFEPNFTEAFDQDDPPYVDGVAEADEHIDDEPYNGNPNQKRVNKIRYELHFFLSFFMKS